MRRVRVALTLMLIALSAAIAAARCTAQHPEALVGDVRNAQGAPVAGAAVSITNAAGVAGTAMTDDAGTFVFRSEPAKPYKLMVVDARADTPPHPVHLVLSAATGAAGIEFSDSPNFTIAGVTDWTAVGGHGSDATLRTSEDLTREAIDLPASEVNAAPANAREQARLEAAHRAAPDNYETNRALGALYLRSGSYSRAEPLLRAAATLHSESAQDQYALALACEGLGDFAQAQQHVRRALTLTDADEFHRLAGEVEEQLGQPVAAAEQLQRALALNASEANYFAWGSELLLHRAIWQAAEIFASGVRAYPQSSRLRTGWGAALFAAARYDEAAKRLCEASTLEPENRETYLLLGKAALAAPEPLPCAQQRLVEFLRLQPQDADAQYYNAMLLLRDNLADSKVRAEEMFRAAVHLNPKLAAGYLQLGILEAGQQHTASAIPLYRQAIQADPQLAEAHYRLGLALDHDGQHDEARRELYLLVQLVHDQE